MRAEQWVGFDLDDVVANLREVMSIEIGMKHKKLSNWKEWNSYDFFRDHMSQEDFQSFLVEKLVLERCKPEPQAREAIGRIRDSGYHVAVITARGFHPDALNLTKKWFLEEKVGVDEVFIVRQGQSKSDILREIPKLHAYVDDHAKHLHDASSEMDVEKLFLIDRPWNQGEHRFQRISHVGEYANEILSKKALSVKRTLRA